MKVVKYDPQTYPELKACKWSHVRQAVDANEAPCELRFVVCDHGRKDAYCKRHLQIEMEDNVRLRAALLSQLADKIIV